MCYLIIVYVNIMPTHHPARNCAAVRRSSGKKRLRPRWPAARAAARMRQPRLPKWQSGTAHVPKCPRIRTNLRASVADGDSANRVIHSAPRSGLMKRGTGSATACTLARPKPLFVAAPVPVFNEFSSAQPRSLLADAGIGKVPQYVPSSSKQFQCSFKAISKQFQSSFKVALAFGCTWFSAGISGKQGEKRYFLFWT